MTHDPSSSPTSRLKRLVAVTTALAALTLVATPALAQQRVAADPGARQGMRYLTWPGKAERPRSAPVPDAAPAFEPPVPSGPILSMSAQPFISRAPNRYSARTSPGPTPASAWLANGGAPVARYTPSPAMAYPPPPGPAYAPPPTYAPPYAAPVPGVPEPPRDYAPVPPTAPVPPPPALQPPVYAEPAPAYAAQPPAPAPVYAPAPPVAADSGPARVEAAPAQPPPAPVAAPPPVPAAPVADPMAPRRDAPIFRLNRNNAPPPETLPEMAPEAEDEAPAPAPRAEAAPPPPPTIATGDDRTPRRYSVHRANGQQPDRTPLPNPVMLDSMPVDLAAPPETPTVVRDANGRVQTIIPNEDPGLQ